MYEIRQRGIQLLSLVLLLTMWGVVSLVVGRGILPSPTEVFPVAWHIVISGDFAPPLFASLFRCFLGFTLSMLLGVTFGISSALFSRLRIASLPIFTIIMSVPSLVMIFALMMMLGQTNFTIILVTGIIVFPFITIPIRDAMKEIDQDALSMADSFKAGNLRKALDIYIPYLLPSILATSRIGFSLSWKVVVLSEVFGFTSGIGWQISLNYFHYDITSLISWLVVFIAVILIFEQILRTAEQRVVRW